MSKIIDIKFLKFISVGIVNTLVGTIIMFCLYNLFGCSYWVSSAANYIIVSILSYLLNKKFTFHYQGEAFKSGMRFAANIVVCYLAAYGAAKPLVLMAMNKQAIYLQENVAMLVGMCIFTGLNYLGQRFFVFGDTIMKYRLNYDNWLQSPYLSAEEKTVLSGMSDEETRDAFGRSAEFGTAGMRGIMGLGTNRINKYTVRMAARGLAELLGKGAGVAIAYDTRNNSREFAEEAAKVLAAAGIKAFLFDRCSPVPLLSFAVRYLGCDGGIVITASHNSREYNGFKVYDRTGSQMMPDFAETVAAYMDNLNDSLNIPVCDMDSDNIEYIGNDIIEKFLDAVDKCAVPTEKSIAEDLKIVYTPLHGSGRDFVAEALCRAGFKNVRMVEEQSGFNGDFPTIKKPNPEDSEVFCMAEEKAASEGADILIGTDPDCDRIGVGVMHNGEIKYLTGNQTGALLIEFLADVKASVGKTLITTIVTSEMGSVVAKSHGINVQKTLTGFKFIGNLMNHMDRESYFMGYEESYGYLVGTHARDKDAVSAAVLICQMAARYKSKGMTLVDVLDRLYVKHGYWMDRQESFSFTGAEECEKIRRVMNYLQLEGDYAFSEIGEIDKFLDYNKSVDGLPPANVFKYVFKNGSWIAVRPSGTEPKIKFYYCIREADLASAQKTYDRITKSTAEIISMA